MRFLLTFFILAISFVSFAATTPPKREFTKPAGYERTAEMYRSYGMNDFGRILMLGDSITHGAYWNELMKRSDVINRGIPGDTTFWMLERLDYVTTGKMEKAFILAGINDISKYQLPASIFGRYTKIIDYLTARGIKPHIQSVIYLGKLNPKYEVYNVRIKELNGMLKEYAEKNGYAFIDLNPVLSPEGFLKNEYTYDGTHLTAVGYGLWRDILAPYMADEPAVATPAEAAPAETQPEVPVTPEQTAPAVVPAPAEPSAPALPAPDKVILPAK